MRLSCLALRLRQRRSVALAVAATLVALVALGIVLHARHRASSPPTLASAPTLAPPLAPTFAWPQRPPTDEVPAQRLLAGPSTVAGRIAECGAAAHARLLPYFSQARVAYPPLSVVLVGLKYDRRLEVYAADATGHMRFIRYYWILGASGCLGPKLRYGDRQVPEGIYRITFLNPNSILHLSLRLNYPNEFDRARGQIDGRTDLGKDIMIHGGTASVGCLAIGDGAIEDLFVLAAETGAERFRVIISPVDFRRWTLDRAGMGLPDWCDTLYEGLRRELAALPL